MSTNRLGSISQKGAAISALSEDIESYPSADDNSVGEVSLRNGGIKLSKTVTMDQTGATTVDLFEITGSAKVKQLYGIISSVTDNADCTDVHFNANDGTNDIAITKTTTGTLTNCEVGSLIIKNDVAANVVDIELNSQIRIEETLGSYKEFFIVGKTGAVTNAIQLIYTGANSFDCDIEITIVVELLGDSTIAVA
jgi:hypothetical protein